MRPKTDRQIESQIEASLTLAPRQQRSREKMDRLFAAGLRMIATHGYDGMTVADLVREAGCPVSTFYQRFRDKEAFLAMLQLRSIQYVREGLERERFFEKLAKVPLEKDVRMIVARLMKAYVEGAFLIRELIRRAPSNPTIQKPLVAWGPYLKRRGVEALAASFPRMSHPHPAVAVEIAIDACLALLNGVLIYEGGPFPLGSPQLAREMERLILGYFGVASDKPPRRTGNKS
ncbi:TetR/AcrR family transcriptional regulator [Candidatus Sumerlaeota bacterium]|nr:TetR/AcrR family transcriptional regulator [Candidatus Sumerlaeota bacterium]